jgi:hypothetical protein
VKTTYRAAREISNITAEPLVSPNIEVSSGSEVATVAAVELLLKFMLGAYELPSDTTSNLYKIDITFTNADLAAGLGSALPDGEVYPSVNDTGTGTNQLDDIVLISKDTSAGILTVTNIAGFNITNFGAFYFVAKAANSDPEVTITVYRVNTTDTRYMDILYSEASIGPASVEAAGVVSNKAAACTLVGTVLNSTMQTITITHNNNAASGVADANRRLVSRFPAGWDVSTAVLDIVNGDNTVISSSIRRYNSSNKVYDLPVLSELSSIDPDGSAGTVTIGWSNVTTRQGVQTGLFIGAFIYDDSLATQDEFENEFSVTSGFVTTLVKIVPGSVIIAPNRHVAAGPGQIDLTYTLSFTLAKGIADSAGSIVIDVNNSSFRRTQWSTCTINTTAITQDAAASVGNVLGCIEASTSNIWTI